MAVCITAFLSLVFYVTDLIKFLTLLKRFIPEDYIPIIYFLSMFSTTISLWILLVLMNLSHLHKCFNAA